MAENSDSSLRPSSALRSEYVVTVDREVEAAGTLVPVRLYKKFQVEKIPDSEKLERESEGVFPVRTQAG